MWVCARACDVSYTVVMHMHFAVNLHNTAGCSKPVSENQSNIIKRKTTPDYLLLVLLELSSLHRVENPVLSKFHYT